MKIRKVSLALAAVISFYQAMSQQSLSIIPQPFFAEAKSGSIIVAPQTEIVLINKDATGSVEYLNQYLTNWLGYKLKVVTKAPDNKDIPTIVYDIKVKADAPDEAYGIKAQNNIVRLMGDAKGLFYATQTILQLMEQHLPADKKSCSIPACNVYDYPRFHYRGLHLDVGRHFFSVDVVKRYIDLMSLYKFNVFHWHLTDDQGWRIEIKKYPKLTQVGSKRSETILAKNFDPYIGDHTPYGGYYTQEQIKEVVKYASERQITIIPEIEMPGHALAALASYPFLGCTKGPYAVGTKWGVYDDVFCAGNDSTFTFLQNVLDEVIQLFPGKYIHVGGDECPKTRWKLCPKCQQRIHDQNLKDEHELQSYFIQRIERYLNSKGRNIIGWDEILEGGLAPNATVMSWRGEEGGIAAAKQKHNAIMTPGKYTYFNYYQSIDTSEPLAIGGHLPLNMVYGYDPFPGGLSPDDSKYILGAQANVWTEYIGYPALLEYMVYPRALALSETLWSAKDKKNYDNFLSRLKVEMKRLDRLKVNYSKQALGISGSISRSMSGTIELQLKTKLDKATIHYTFDGTQPDNNSPLYTNPINVTESGTIRANVFSNEAAFGKEYRQAFVIHKGTGKRVIIKNQPAREYNPGNDFALVNGIEGNESFNDNNWFGFSGKDLDAVIDLETPTELKTLGINFINAPGDWIYPPSKLSVLVSNDGMVFREVFTETHFEGGRLMKLSIPINPVTTRFVRVIAQNLGKIPGGKPGEGHDAWLFVDEIKIY